MKVALFANTDWYLYNFRRSLAIELKRTGCEVLLLSPPGPYGDQLRALGFRWVPVPMHRRSLNPLREFVLVQWLRRLFELERPDVVHGFTIKPAVYGSIAAKMAGIAGRVNAVAGMGYVFTSRAPLARVLRPVVSTLMRVALDGDSSRLILQNPDDVALFERAKLVDRTRVRLIPGSGVDCQRFAPRAVRAERSVGDCFRIVLPARILWDKGVAEYVEASRLLRGSHRNVAFVLAGKPDPGNPASVPGNIIQEWVREGLVEWVGHVDDMPKLFSEVDAVCLPSYREGLPKGLIEAAACGLPLVTTDAPGCREVVTDGKDGLLVPPKDPAALARAIARLQDDPGLCAQLGAAAREKALLCFDERVVLANTLAVYREVVPGFRPANEINTPVG